MSHMRDTGSEPLTIMSQISYISATDTPQGSLSRFWDRFNLTFKHLLQISNHFWAY